ncbi:hypothetical protein CLOM_g17831 [Closterium sp. NIES-68]|nr:hypothetical protein CLOM_g17831 [Closterium sp. NIES-68]
MDPPQPLHPRFRLSRALSPLMSLFIVLLLFLFAYPPSLPLTPPRFPRRLSLPPLASLSSLLSFPSRLPPPPPLLPIPTARQLTRQRAELAAFFHVGVNTFTDREWGTGGESPSLFNPAALNATQWVATVKDAGFKLVVLTAKHHDGFCLWPSALTSHSVRSAPWKAGRGDVVADVAAAARAAGVGMGLYLSPWDRHEAAYEAGTEAYNAFYEGQLRELLTRYGPIAEVWLDGAKGDDRPMAYHTATWQALIRQLQPGAAVFSAQGPDLRWTGNERGEAGSTCWGTVNGSELTLEGWDTDYLNHGDVAGVDWIPPECDVSIRPGWFWHPLERPKPLAHLLDLYLASVGRGCCLLLNIPPNTTGLLHAEDVQRVGEFGRAVRGLFQEEVSAGARVGGGGRGEYGPENVLRAGDGDFWAAEDGVLSAVLEFDLGQVKSFHVARLEEPVAYGQRIKAFSVEFLDDGTDVDADAAVSVPAFESQLSIGSSSAATASTVRHMALHVVQLVGRPVGQWWGQGWGQRWVPDFMLRLTNQRAEASHNPRAPESVRRTMQDVGGVWRVVVNGTTVGRKRLARFEAVRARRVRVVIHDARAAPLLSFFAIYRSGDGSPE